MPIGCDKFDIFNFLFDPKMRFWLFVGILFILGSCVSNKKIQLLQKADVNTKSLPLDTVLRTYSPEVFDYKIQPNDVLSIRFQSMTDAKFDFLSSGNATGQLNVNPIGAVLSGDLVDQNGEVPFPVLGKVKVSGLTIYEINEKLQALANQYLEAPVVKVRLLNFRITLLGEVNGEGTVILTNNRVSLLEAIGLAGGLGELADRSKIKLIRQKDGAINVQYINLLDEGFVHSPYYYVYQNDILIVPPLKQRSFRKYFGPNLSLIIGSITLLLLTYSLVNRP
jgi:polysaccharide export outer membrane protein